MRRARARSSHSRALMFCAETPRCRAWRRLNCCALAPTLHCRPLKVRAVSPTIVKPPLSGANRRSRTSPVGCRRRLSRMHLSCCQYAKQWRAGQCSWQLQLWAAALAASSVGPRRWQRTAAELSARCPGQMRSSPAQGCCRRSAALVDRAGRLLRLATALGRFRGMRYRWTAAGKPRWPAAGRPRCSTARGLAPRLAAFFSPTPCLFSSG